MSDYEIILDGRQLRTEGLARHNLADIVINDVAPEHETLGRTLLARIVAGELEGREIEDGASISDGYWDPILRKRDENLYEVFEWTPDRRVEAPGINTTATYLLEQGEMCRTVGAAFVPPMPKQLIAASRGVLEGTRPLEGIRYQAPPHMSGWYLTTDEYDGNVDSLHVDHVYHITSARPELTRLLALPPGYWFILHDGNEEIGFDADVAEEGL